MTVAILLLACLVLAAAVGVLAVALRELRDRVRVLEYKDIAGEKTQQHSHPAFVLVALSPFKRKITLPDGKAIVREFKAGDVLWSDAQTHIGENIGEAPTHVMMIEMK